MSEETNDKPKVLIKERAADGRISCKAAWRIANELGTRILGYELGCF